MNAIEIKEQQESIFKDTIKTMLENGQTIVIVRDNDDEAWESGWATFLSDNYEYSNLNSAFRVNLERKKATA
jgi:hypothetical protein